MKALLLNGTLKRSPDPSNTGMVAEEVLAGLRERDVECETVRLVDLNLPPVSAPTRATATSGRR